MTKQHSYYINPLLCMILCAQVNITLVCRLALILLLNHMHLKDCYRQLERCGETRDMH